MRFWRDRRRMFAWVGLIAFAGFVFVLVIQFIVDWSNGYPLRLSRQNQEPSLNPLNETGIQFDDGTGTLQVPHGRPVERASSHRSPKAKPSKDGVGAKNTSKTQRPPANSSEAIVQSKANTKSTKPIGTLVALGDSITFGFNLPGAKGLNTPSPDAYPYLLGKMLNYKVMDLGVPRWGTSNLIKALHSKKYQSALQKATLVTVDIGSNDILYSFNGIVADYMQGIMPASLAPTLQSVNQSIQNLSHRLQTIVDLIRKQTDAPIVLTTLYDPVPDHNTLHDFADPYLTQANQVIMNSAATNHTLLYDAYSTVNHHQWSLIRVDKFDIHPNITGQKALAAGFYTALENPQLHTPTRYDVTDKGATIFSTKNRRSKPIGRMMGVTGYPVVRSLKDWDEIRYQNRKAYVQTNQTRALLRLSDTVTFGAKTFIAQSASWQYQNGATIQGFTINGQAFVPVSKLAQAAGTVAKWNNSAREVDIPSFDPAVTPNVAPTLKMTSHTPGSPEVIHVVYAGVAIRIGGELLQLGAEPFSYHNTIYVPAGPVWAALGGQTKGLTGGL